MEQWIRIGNYDYDVQNFCKKHPGGNVIKYMLNEDATDVYKEFHARSLQADNF